VCARRTDAELKNSRSPERAREHLQTLAGINSP